MFDGTYQKAKKNNAFLSRQKVILSLLQRWHFRFRTECGFAYWWQFHKCNYPIWSFVCILFVEFFFLRNSSLITFANFNPIWIYWNLKSTFEKNERENSRQNIQWRNSSKDWLDWQIILNSYLLQRKQHRCTTHNFPIKFRNGIYKNAFRICKICVDNVVQGVRKHTEWTMNITFMRLHQNHLTILSIRLLFSLLLFLNFVLFIENDNWLFAYFIFLLLDKSRLRVVTNSISFESIIKYCWTFAIICLPEWSKVLNIFSSDNENLFECDLFSDV